MIVDKISNLEQYIALNPRIQVVVDYLKEHPLADLPIGQHVIIPQEVYVNCQEQPPKEESKTLYESHLRMMDIHMPLSGEEGYGHELIEPQEEGFDNDKDIQFYNIPSSGKPLLVVRPGEFVLFLPQDAHKPCITLGGVRKCVFKVKI